MVSLIFVVFAACFNAVMDALENENFFESIFKTLNKNFWYKRESWKHCRKILGYRFDAWHISKSLMILSIASALSFGIYEKPLFETGYIALNILVKYISYGLIWNIAFTLLYHRVFKIK
jgi:hypothetical protein